MVHNLCRLLHLQVNLFKRKRHRKVFNWVSNFLKRLSRLRQLLSMLCLAQNFEKSSDVPVTRCLIIFSNCVRSISSHSNFRCRNERNLRQDDPTMGLLCRVMRLARIEKFYTIKWTGTSTGRGREFSQRVDYCWDLKLLPSAFLKWIFFTNLTRPNSDQDKKL